MTSESKHFSCGDDVRLLRCAAETAPWQASRVMDAWDALATRLRSVASFPRDKDARAIRTRFHLLVKKHRTDQLSSMRATGNLDQYLEREQLLCAIDKKLRAVASTKKHPRVEEESTGSEVEGTPPGGSERSDEFVPPGAYKKKRRRVEEDGDGMHCLMAARSDRAMMALLERVLDQQQQQITQQRELIERQITMQQQQMEMLMQLVDRIARR